MAKSDSEFLDGLLGIRRCPWRINQPANVRVIKLAAIGSLSTNEA